jgi:hypothetical protein
MSAMKETARISFSCNGTEIESKKSLKKVTNIRGLAKLVKALGGAETSTGSKGKGGCELHSHKMA